jgi:alpha-methylacyl-CoA racemase
MVDGVSLLLAQTWGLRNAGLWRAGRGRNLLDGGAPFYDTYLCADGRYVALAALEPQFYAEFLAGVADIADTSAWPDRADRERWDELRACIATAFLRRGRDEWAERFADTDACVAPVLDPDEAAEHPHLLHRGTHRPWAAGGRQPAPAPRFSRSPVRAAAGVVDEPAVRAAWGLDAE